MIELDMDEIKELRNLLEGYLDIIRSLKHTVEHVDRRQIHHTEISNLERAFHRCAIKSLILYNKVYGLILHKISEADTDSEEVSELLKSLLVNFRDMHFVCGFITFDEIIGILKNKEGNSNDQ